MATEQMMLDGSGVALGDMVRLALDRLRLHEPEEGYWLADSYGKDSTVLLDLARVSGVAFEAHHSRTTLDPPELMRFGRKYHRPLGVVEHAPKERFELTLWRKRCPPMRHIRWCCETLKEGLGRGRIVLTGVRWAESRRRRTTRRLLEACYRKDGTRYLHPIIDWTDSHVWQFIRTRGLPYCELYDQGWKRIGCLMCPMARPARRAADARRYPRFRRRIVRAFGTMLTLPSPSGQPWKWKTGEECFEWWMADHRHPKRHKDAEGQGFIFEDGEEE